MKSDVVTDDRIAQIHTALQMDYDDDHQHDDVIASVSFDMGLATTWTGDGSCVALSDAAIMSDDSTTAHYHSNRQR